MYVTRSADDIVIRHFFDYANPMISKKMSQPITDNAPNPPVPGFPELKASDSERELLHPIVLKPESLKSQHSYTCANHPNEEAFCLCAKCGNKLCRSCCVSIIGRRYCINCVVDDDNLRTAYDREMLRPKIFQAALEIQSVKAPQKISDLPNGLYNLIFKTTIFVINARKSPFKLTFPIALIAMAPKNIVSIVFYLDKLVPQTEKYKPAYEMLTAMPVASRIFTALITTAIQILLIDVVFYSCAKTFTTTNMTFTQAASVMHYCMIPLIFYVLGLVFDIEVISFISVILMIMLTTVASRASTQTTFLRSFGLMIVFIAITSLLRLID